MPPEAHALPAAFSFARPSSGRTIKQTVNPRLLSLSQVHRQLRRWNVGMLKQVMMGAGGILLAAAIFASSITPGTVQADGATTPSPSTPPVVQAVPPVVSSSQPRSVFGEETGDIQFGAPMIPAEPQREVSTDPDPGPSVDQNGPANGRRTFAPRPGMPYPQPH